MLPPPTQSIAYQELALRGDKTINQIQAEAGRPPVAGGDRPYWRWLLELALLAELSEPVH